MRTQINDIVCIYFRDRHEFYRVQASGLEMFMGFGPNLPLNNDMRRAMEANDAARAKAAREAEEARVAHQARLDAMSQSELRAYFDQQFTPKRNKV